MSAAMSYARAVPLHDNQAHQTCTELSLSEVPTLSESATVGNATSRSVRYDAGTESWFVLPSDKKVIRAYRRRRSDADIEAGAYPVLTLYFDNKGPL
jgi:hypothetical protein